MKTHRDKSMPHGQVISFPDWSKKLTEEAGLKKEKEKGCQKNYHVINEGDVCIFSYENTDSCIWHAKAMYSNS